MWCVGVVAMEARMAGSGVCQGLLRSPPVTTPSTKRKTQPPKDRSETHTSAVIQPHGQWTVNQISSTTTNSE